MARRKRRRPFWLPDPYKWHSYMVWNSDIRKKEIELKIARKRYEIDVLNIELKYWDTKKEKKRKIWFDTEEK